MLAFFQKDHCRFGINFIQAPILKSLVLYFCRRLSHQKGEDSKGSASIHPSLKQCCHSCHSNLSFWQRSRISLCSNWDCGHLSGMSAIYGWPLCYAKEKDGWGLQPQYCFQARPQFRSLASSELSRSLFGLCQQSAAGAEIHC